MGHVAGGDDQDLAAGGGDDLGDDPGDLGTDGVGQMGQDQRDDMESRLQRLQERHLDLEGMLEPVRALIGHDRRAGSGLEALGDLGVGRHIAHRHAP